MRTDSRQPSPDKITDHLNDRVFPHSSKPEECLNKKNTSGVQRRQLGHGALQPAGEVMASYDLDIVVRMASQALRQLRTPLRQRLYFDRNNLPTPPQVSADIEAVYGESVALLDALEHHRRSMLSSHDRRHTVGLVSELAIFSLLARDMTGEEDDEFVAIPSTISEDVGVPAVNTLQGYDLKVIHRPAGEAVKIQVKTSRAATQTKRYDQSIVVVSLEEIAGGLDRVRPLVAALIHEVEGAEYDESAIKDAQHRLHIATLNKSS